jgi:hypothetical protein
MANMSYCRFENTYRDLLDCLSAMNERLSESESAYRRRLVDVCKEIIDEYDESCQAEDGDEDNNDEISWDTQTK